MTPRLKFAPFSTYRGTTGWQSQDLRVSIRVSKITLDENQSTHQHFATHIC